MQSQEKDPPGGLQSRSLMSAKVHAEIPINCCNDLSATTAYSRKSLNSKLSFHSPPYLNKIDSNDVAGLYEQRQVAENYTEYR